MSKRIVQAELKHPEYYQEQVPFRLSYESLSLQSIYRMIMKDTAGRRTVVAPISLTAALPLHNATEKVALNVSFLDPDYMPAFQKSAVIESGFVRLDSQFAVRGDTTSYHAEGIIAELPDLEDGDPRLEKEGFDIDTIMALLAHEQSSEAQR